LWPGILAALLSTLAVDYCFIPPIGAFGPISPEDVPELIVFAASALFVSWLNGEQKRANVDLARENRDRRKAEEALRASERRLQDIVGNSTAVIFVKDLELRYLLVNREFERLHQVQREQIRGKTNFELHPPTVAEAVRANDRRVIDAGEPIQFEEVLPSLEDERVYVSAKFLLRDRTGIPYAVCGIATDITALKRAEELEATMAREREQFAQQPPPS
jgi:PAS domain S-box-containing protein